MRSLLSLTKRQLTRFCLTVMSAIALYMLSLPPLSILLGARLIYRVWVIGGAVVLGAAAVLYLVLILHYALFRGRTN